MDFITTTTPIAVAAEYLNEALAAHTSRPLLVMLSGGSAIAVLDYVNTSFLGPQVTITTLDERFSTDPTINNFAQIAVTGFYQNAVEHGASVIATTVNAGETLRDVKERFTHALQDWKAKYPDGVVVATMGIGSDGHTAGIFPNQSGIDYATTDWVAAYTVSANNIVCPERITVTPTFLQTHVTRAIAVVMREEKRSALTCLQSNTCNRTDVPACIMKDMASVTITTDLAM